MCNARKISGLLAVLMLVGTLAHASGETISIPNLGDIPPGVTVRIQYDAVIDATLPGTENSVSNQGTISGGNIASFLTDDPGTAGAPDDPTVTSVPTADVSLAIVDSEDPTQEGNTLTYTLTVTNPSLADDAQNVEVVLTLDGGLIYQSDSCSVGAPAGNTWTWTIGALAADSSEQCTIDFTVDTGTNGTTLSSSGTVTTTTDDPDTNNNSPTVDTDVAIGTTTSVVSSLDPAFEGQQVTFTITVTPGTATGTVDLSSDQDGVLATGLTLDGANQATFMTNTLSVNTHTITADYSGDATHAPSSGNTTQTINDDNVDPVINLSGDNPLDLPCATPYSEPGFTATDNVDGDITGQVQVTGTVDENTRGQYTLTYTVTDNAGNTSQTTRIVNVVESLNCPPTDDIHTADIDRNNVLDLQEVLRVIQLFNNFALHCADNFTDTVDGYVPGTGANQSCRPHSSDYNSQNWIISLSELLRAIQFFNLGGYSYCPGVGPDDFCGPVL